MLVCFVLFFNTSIQKYQKLNLKLQLQNKFNLTKVKVNFDKRKDFFFGDKEKVSVYCVQI